jgi:hypothetical protein
MLQPPGKTVWLLNFYHLKLGLKEHVSLGWPPIASPFYQAYFEEICFLLGLKITQDVQCLSQNASPFGIQLCGECGYFEVLYLFK